MVEIVQADIDEEGAVIGAVLIEPWRVDDLKDHLPATIFQSSWHGTLWSVLQRTPQPMTVDQVVDAAGPDLAVLGGRDYLVGRLGAMAGGVAWASDHALYLDAIVPRIVQRGLKRIAAQALEVATKAAQTRSATYDDVLSLMAVAADAIHSHAAGNGGKDSTTAIADYIEHADSGGDPRITTGYEGLDDKGAFVPGGLYTVAARSGEGKSSLVANFACRLHKAGVPFGLVSVEMTQRQMVNSIIGTFTGINRKKLLASDLTLVERNERDEAALALRSGWYINDREGMTVEKIVAQGRAWVRRHGIKVLMVDHLQRVKATDPTLPRHLQVGHITWALKGLARAENIVVILAVQINREGAREGVPKLHHLKESGSVEEDSDGVIAIYVDRTKNDLDSQQWLCDLWWLKNRHGAVGTCPIMFDKPSGRMTEHVAEPRRHTARDFDTRRDLA